MSKEVQSLEDLPDEYPKGSKPIYSYHTLVRCAIQGSSSRPLTADEIIDGIERRFSYFKENKNGNCKTYLANTLANTPCFMSGGRGPLPTEFYWEYDPSNDPQRRYSLTFLTPPAPTSMPPPTPPPPTHSQPSEKEPSTDALLLVQEMQAMIAKEVQEEEQRRKTPRKPKKKGSKNVPVSEPEPAPAPKPVPVALPELSPVAVAVSVTNTNGSAGSSSDEKATTRFQPVRRPMDDTKHAKPRKEVYTVPEPHDSRCCIIA
ncbi:hypothetical protein NLJ89_g6475 [Agrocybe chaxingu]|uniref:Fork-head domain-containing protein n=1 Tax=Agrocybe chaxingu TaxID=84603 RepID=A0A9W8K5H0_9AGAR|nr:hypothetical protein NLJ89_g6475 [Agrocybe chaxingu]